MVTKLQYLIKILFLLVISTLAYCAHSKGVLINANDLKDRGFQDGQTGTVNIDLNSDRYQDTLEYTFSSTTPPGTCDQSDCMSSLDNSPILTFQIKMHDGKSIYGSYMCTSLSVSKERHNGMKDILCGPMYILRWNSEEYEVD